MSPLAYANLKGAANTNPTTYEEGKALALAAPGAVTGYTFAGWTPSAITADMTGAQTVTANWTANRYQIVYKANGGSGMTEATDCEYDAEGEIAANAFAYADYVFKGWATEEGGEAVYEADEDGGSGDDIKKRNWATACCPIHRSESLKRLVHLDSLQ